MDPDATYEMLKELAEQELAEGDGESDQMAELFLALDKWISDGGFLPKPWRRDASA